MKKIAIASIIALAAVSASALEVGVTTSTSFAGADRAATGATVGTSLAGFGVTAGVEKFTKGANDQTRWSLVADRALTTVGPVALSARAGVAFLDNQSSTDGYALVVGAGASLPVTKQVSLDLGVARQYGQKRVSGFDGNVATLGLKYKF